MKTFWSAVLTGVVVVMVGYIYVVNIIYDILYSTKSLEVGASASWGMYLCFVIVVCTRLILAKLDKLRDSNKRD